LPSSLLNNQQYQQVHKLQPPYFIQKAAPTATTSTAAVLQEEECSYRSVVVQELYAAAYTAFDALNIFFLR
jgi:hypothetical protein